MIGGSDLGKHVRVLSQCVDLEHREARITRQWTGLLEVEEAGLQKSPEATGIEPQAAPVMCAVSRIEAD